jgi:carboxyl-terminal processing protease
VTHPLSDQRSAAAPANRRRPRRAPRAVVAALALSLAFGAGVGVDRIAWQGGSSAGASSSFTELAEFETLQATWDLIHDEYVAADQVDDRELIYAAAAGMVESLGDTGHSRFLPPEDAEEFEQATQGKFVGIGVELDTRDGRPIVVAPIDGSPADEAGILPGDTILEVNGRSTEGLTFEELRDLIRGDAGGSVTLRLRHVGADDAFEVTLIRRVIVIRPVSWRMLPGQVAHVRLSDFSVGATKELEAALAAAREAGAEGIVLDLRNNPGGLVAEAIGVASQFMPEGTTIFQQQEKDGEPNPVRTVGHHGRGLDLPLVVLANGYSASAAEIVAGALRDNGRARFLGTTTYGTGTVLIPFEQKDGSVVLLGTALWLTADGDQIWREGVEPDEVVELAPDAIPSRPSDDPEVTPAELRRLEDAQLRAAHAEVVEHLDEGQTRTPPGP